LVAIHEEQKRWHQFDPVMMMDLHKTQLMKLKGFKFDCGRLDTRTLDANRVLSKKLKAVGIPVFTRNMTVGVETNAVNELKEVYCRSFQRLWTLIHSEN